MANSYPEEVEAFHEVLLRLAGVRQVATGLKRLEDVSPDSYSQPGEIGDWPHALLRRTDGGLPNEYWAATELELSRDKNGWLTLELLAGWVRELSRSGDQIQMRPLALPPNGQDGAPFGGTLKFVIGHFADCPDNDLAPMLKLMRERAESLNQHISLHAEALGKLVKKSRSRPKRSPARKTRAKS